ncbi:hypothetical protein ACTQ6A_04980 [Lachnospiraceae bacterium LCP25S3_G4]
MILIRLGGREVELHMHPYFWLIMFCAAIAITIAIILNKKKK